MTERPILFNGPMVRAIIEGQKTVTRRVVKGAAAKWLIDFTPEFVADRKNDLCPFGQPGDRLWVRESFADLRGTGIEHRPDPAGPLSRYAFAADSPPGSASDEARKDFGVKWKPSIHMPRIACRILLEITAVRVERLQDISEEQAEAEGTAGCVPYCQSPYDSDGAPACDCMNLTYKESFQALWHSINGAKSWDANPWVWVVEFRRVAP